MNIVFCDIDGTFEDLNGVAPAINYEAIYALQKQGDHFVFISGRGYKQLEALLASLDSECDVIFSNGAGYHLIGEEVVYNHCLTLANCERVIKILEDRNIFYHIHTNEGIILHSIEQYAPHIQALREKLAYMGAAGTQIVDFKEQFFTEECQHVADPFSYLKAHPELKVMKIELMEADDTEIATLRELLQNEESYVFSSYIQCLEVTHPLSSKGYAVKEFMAKFPGGKSYGIGDGENDLAMLEVVDTSVAMGNAVPSVKNICDYITSDCVDGGVGEFIFNKIIK